MTAILNPRYAHATPSGATATRVPPGRWVVRVREEHDGWSVQAEQDGDSFVIAFSTDRREAFAAGVQWQSSASTLCLSMDRVRFEGFVREAVTLAVAA